MKSLQERLLEITVQNTVKKSVKTSINDLILKVLTEKNEKLSRPEIVSRIAKLRYEDEFKKELKDSDLDKPEVLEDLLKIIKTVKNGVDTSISKSNNNSSFHYNENFASELLPGIKLNLSRDRCSFRLLLWGDVSHVT